MAELDYAYLADSAQVQGGKLFVLGASFTHVQTPVLGVGFPLSVAGRIKAAVGEVCDLELSFATPEEQLVFSANITLTDNGASRPYGKNNDKVGLLFAMNTQIPIVSAGLYVVWIKLSGGQSRRLAFDVEVVGE